MELQKKTLKVSVCVVTYNQEKYIEDACKAALAQTYSPLEIIFSDDASPDKTFDIILENVKNYNGIH